VSLKERDFVKIICAAGTEDPKIVRNIALIYTLAGADCIDIAANPSIVKAACEGREAAIKIAEKMGVPVPKPPLFCISFGIEGDQHVRKARVTEIGKNLFSLTKVCPTGAIVGGTNGEPVRVIEPLCIGAGKCALVRQGAIEFYTLKRNLPELLPLCKAEGADMFELHSNAGVDEEIVATWKLMNSINPDGFISMCIGRSYKSNKEVLERIEKIRAISGERTIIQTDGNPMTGESESINSGLQAVAMGDLVRKMKNPPFVILSGGTNMKTVQLAKVAGVLINGISFGSYARKIVYKYITMEGLLAKETELKEAVIIASEFVSKVKADLRNA